MRVNDILPKFAFRPNEAAHAMGSEQLFRECVRAGWLKPVVQRHKLTLFDRRHVEACWMRILSGEIPGKVVP
jgi:hypothetical protein